MTDTDRLHALDGVRAWALILGVFLHATMPWLDGLPDGFWVWIEPPSDVLAGVFWFIHLFRMSAFFLIAGLFARMVVERRGAKAFVRDRAKRIGIPLFLGLPIILASIIGAAVAAAMLVGIEPMSLLGAAADPSTAEEIPDGYFPWAHLWFLYYLLVFYLVALLVRAIVHRLDSNQTLRGLLDRITTFAFSGPWGAIVPTVPIGLFLYFHAAWVPWFGLPAPYLIWPELSGLISYGVPFALGWLVHRLDSNQTLRGMLDRITTFAFSGPWGAIVPTVPIGLFLYFHAAWVPWFGLPAPYLMWPELSGLISYGVPFALGWLVHRQLSVLLSLGQRWLWLLLSALVLALATYIMAGPTPDFSTELFFGSERLIYTTLYLLAQWCTILAFIAFAVRFWSNPSPLRRYVADSSYWLYLFHMTTLAFIQVVLGPLDWHWSLKYAVAITFSLPILFISYHYLVRATFIGALLNGRRRPRQFLFSQAQVG